MVKIKFHFKFVALNEILTHFLKQQPKLGKLVQNKNSDISDLKRQQTIHDENKKEMNNNEWVKKSI